MVSVLAIEGEKIDILHGIVVLILESFPEVFLFFFL